MAEKARILIVDDALLTRKMIGDIIKMAGYEIVAEASNGKEAVDMYKEHKPDLVTMDIVMPEMDGITAVKEIAKIDPDCRIIMVSAMGQQQQVIEAIQSGAKDFIVKPFDAPRVMDAIEKALKS